MNWGAFIGRLVRFSGFLNADAGRRVRRAVAEYVSLVVESEWPALAERHRDRGSEEAFAKLFDCVLRVGAGSPEEIGVCARLVDIVREAGEHRDERLTKSLTQIPATLIHLVHTMALALLLLVFVYPFHLFVAGLCCFLLVGVILSLANLVMTDTDNPFQGIYNVSPAAFGDLRSQG